MLNHTVIFWVNPEIPGAADELLATFEGLRQIPGVLHLSYGKKLETTRPQKPTVDQR